MSVFSVISIAAGVGLESVSLAPSRLENRVWTSQQLISKMENLHDTTYSSLVSTTYTSDADYRNTTYTITCTVTEIDPASPTASPPVALAASGLKQIVLSMNGQSITSWVSQ
jgi:hypothetical protein